MPWTMPACAGGVVVCGFYSGGYLGQGAPFIAIVVIIVMLVLDTRAGRI